ncbi:MAG TPA: MoaD/ThiS family protein [Vicinamibacteria bacterium]|jgi:molybdopterin synthase sulfur carrier subunit|nr:MoaD/ThiS family protein [Vicinamibacteria bacterium]
MPVRVQIPGPMRPLTGGKSEVEIDAADVASLIAALDDRHRGVRDRLLDASGNLRGHVRVFVNDEDVRALQQEATPLHPGDRVAIVPAIAGGACP